MTRTKALTDVLDDLAGFKFDVAQYYSDFEPEPQMVIDAVLHGKINSLRLFCQTLGWSDLVAALGEMIPLRGSAVPSLSTIQEFVIPEVRSRLATTDVDSSKTSPAERSSGSQEGNTLEDDRPLIDVSATSRGNFLDGGYMTQGIAKGAMPTDSAAWRGIRQDFESLPEGDWRLSWTSRPPMAFFLPIQLQSQWNWLGPTDASLRARASAIFVKAAKARGYDSEDQWLDELRHADFVRFRISGAAREKLPDGTLQERESGVLEDAIKHSITLCHQLEADDVPKPIALRLSSDAIAKLDAATAVFLANFLPKLERETPKLEDSAEMRIREAELLRELVIHHFEGAAAECMRLCASVAEFEAELRAGVAGFVHFSVGQYRWLGDAMRSELDAGFAFFTMRANPWVGIAEAQKYAKWHVGAITGEALADTALKLRAQALKVAAEGGFSKANQAQAPEKRGVETVRTIATPMEAVGNAKGRKRGPKPDHKSAARVAEIVARVAPDGDWRLKLDDLGRALYHGVCHASDPETCVASDHEKIPPPRGWSQKGNKWIDPPDRATMVKAIEYRLEAARKKPLTETLS